MKYQDKNTMVDGNIMRIQPRPESFVLITGEGPNLVLWKDFSIVRTGYMTEGGSGCAGVEGSETGHT